MNNNFLSTKILPDKSNDLLRFFAIQDFIEEEKLINQFINNECHLRIDEASTIFHFSDEKMLDKKIKYLEIFKDQLNSNTIISPFTFSCFGFSSHKFARHVWAHPIIENFSAEQKQQLLKLAAISASDCYKRDKAYHFNNFQSTLTFLIKDLGLVFNHKLKKTIFNHHKINGDELSAIVNPIIESIELEKSIIKGNEVKKLIKI